MSCLFVGTGPGNYRGQDGTDHTTELNAALSGIRASGSVNDANVPYSGTPREAAQKAIANGDQDSFDYIKKNYSF